MKIPVGSKITFKSEKLRYTVQASDERYAICTKPFNLKRTVLYTICDFKIGMRGPENLIFSMGAETRERCEEMLARLTMNCDHDPSTVHCDCRTEVSHRNRIEIDIQFIEPPKDKV